MKNKLILTVAISLAIQSGFARESWPQPTDEAREQMASFKQHEQDVLTQIAPQLAEWAKNGKPFYADAIVPADLPQAKVPAFPGAEGAGKFSFGGRGGRVFVVTNLNDSGPGSLREAVESAGPRVVVFNVAGIIHLKMPLFVEAPYLTIDGHTAPGDGICVAGESTLINTHDVVIRYLRFRRGNMNVFDRDDALGGNPIGNIIVDHCSCSWGGDENLSMYRHITPTAQGGTDEKLPTLNITLQWNISSEALNTYNHAFGGTWGGRNSSFHHNLFACNTGRNPSIGMTYDFNFVNNVLFNWRHRTVDGGDRNSLYNIINNYYKPGPAVNHGPIAYRVLEPAATQNKQDPTPHFGKAYVAGNVVEGNEKVSADNWAGGVQFADGGSKDDPTISTNENVKKLVAQVRVDKAFPMAAVTTTAAKDAYDDVLKNAGATLPHRDPVDERVIAEVKTGKVWSEGKEFTPPPMEGLAKNNWGVAGNGIITEPSQIGGYPEYKGDSIKDLCSDGILLSWKKKFGLDVNDGSLAQKDLQGDGYTVMDKYLAGLDPTKKIDWSDTQEQRQHFEVNGGAKKVSSYAWAVVALLWPVVLLNYLDRQMVSTIRASIRADIPSIANDQDFGTLIAVFMWVYAFLSPVGGFIADKFNRRWTIIGSLFVWSAVTWATGHAQTYSQMLTLRALMGISEAFYIPAALALITDFHTGNTRAKAVGLHQTGIYAGLALGGIGGYIADHSSWRNCFTWFGAVGVIYAVVLMFALRDADRQNPTEEKKSIGVGETILALWSQPAFWILVIYFTLPAIAGWVTKNWLPTFLADTFNLKQGPAGLSATGYIQLASLAGVFFGGVIADWWMRKTNRGRIFTSALGVFLLVPALLLLGYAWALPVAIAAMVLFGIGWGFFDCNNMPILCQIARPEHRATGYGFMNLVSISVGAGATVALGWMRDHGIKFSVAFGVSAAVALLSVGLILLVKPRAANFENS